MSSVSSVSSVESVDIDLSISSVSITDDDDDDLEVSKSKKERVSRFRDRANPFDLYSETEFKKIFGLSKFAVQEIIKPIERQFKPFTLRNQPISAMNQLLIALRYFTSGSHQMTVADIFNVSQASVCRIVRRISNAITTLADEYIKMPESSEEIKEVCAEFEEISGFPNVIGVIDCMHVRILSPSIDNQELFKNDNGWASVNVQIICDANLRIRDVVAHSPGSFHDNAIFNESMIKERLEKNVFGDTYLLGDNAYHSQKYLLTPVLNPKSQSELKYNEAHRKTRERIEMTLTLLKKRFSCLLSVIRVSLDKIISTILAVCILHNICLDINEPLDDSKTFSDEQSETENVEDDETFLEKRNAVISKYFSN